MNLSVDITNFTAGELSPRMNGRFDFAKYYNGCETALNLVAMPQGGATRRPGTYFVALNKAQAAKNRLKAFIFSNQQPYMLEFSDQAVRIYKTDAVVISGGNPVDVVVPYRTADLAALKFAQSADTLFIAHPSYPPASITRTSDTAWSYTVLTFQDGPWLDQNLTTNAVTPSGTSGSITLTWDAATNINGGAGFSSPADVGRLVRLKLFSLWATCKITAVTNTTTVTATVQAKTNNGNDAAIDGAAWAATTKYDKGAVVKNSANAYFIATAAGQSESNGPFGQGNAILDGTVLWSALTGLDASPYEQSTNYNVGDVVYSGTQPGYYQAENAGRSYSGGSLSGTGAGISDGPGGPPILWTYIPPFALPTKTTNWQLGAWSAGQGYPYTVRFWQQRLFWGGFPSAPNRIFGSVTGDFLNHAPSKSDGTVLDTSALNWQIDDDKVQAIQWLIGAGSAQAQQLGMGTAAGEQILQGASAAQALTPTSVQAYGETAYGSAANVEPLRIGKAVLFADRTGRKLREWAFYWQMNGYNGPDLLQFSEHIARAGDGSNQALNGIATLVYQQAPYQLIWAVTNDGRLLSFTYDRDQNVFAPMRHQLGGSYYGGPPVIESIDVIPSSDNSYDELWLSVLRTINGTPTRTMEVMTRWFDGQPQDQAIFVDCALSSALTFPAASCTPSGLTNANAADAALPVAYTGTGTFTASAGVFSAGDVGKMIRINGGRAQITAYTSSTVVSAIVLLPLLSLAPAAQNAWSATAPAASFSGISHLNGETVSILGDGAVMGTAVVSGGIATLASGKASFATIGLASTWLLVSMPFEPARAAAAAASGKIKRVTEMWARFHETLGASFGRRLKDPYTDQLEDKTEPLEDRRGAQAMDQPPPLFSGIRRLDAQGGFDQEGQVIFFGSDPLPATILSVVANAEVEELPTQEAA